LIKNIVKKYFESLVYFYSHLRYRVFIVFALSFFVAILDGLGLTMFLPLLQMVNDSATVDPEGLGKLSFLVEFLDHLGIELSLFIVLIVMGFFFLTKGLVQYFTGIYRVLVQQRFVSGLRIKCIKGLNNLSFKYFVVSDAGRIQNALTGEIVRVTTSFTLYFAAFQAGILVFVYMLFAFLIDAQFAILVSLGGILTNFLYKNLYKNTKTVSRKLTADANVYQNLIIQNVANYKYLKATGTLDTYGEKLVSSVKKMENSNKKIGKLAALLNAGREPILVVVVITVIYIQIAPLGSELAPILISLIFFYRALNYLMQMQISWNKFLANSGSLENITLFEKELKKHSEVTGRKKIQDNIEILELQNISFYYGKNLIINNINLFVTKQETLAFVGESGSGKTTLVNIIAGLLPVDNGEYLINKQSSRSLDLNDFQKRIGYITQDSVIFNDTLFNNVTFWADQNEKNIEKFWEAIRKASLLDFLDSLPEREKEILGNNGINLSGGQKQRVSIARELYKNVEVLILDEATSALDSETEKAIQKNIEDLKGEYTILIVAHRLSTIKNADRIVVMKNGRISHIGNFDDLIEESLYFKKLVELQEI